MKKLSKKQKQKNQIFSLAEKATVNIIKNRIILSHINHYKHHIELIKSFISKCSEKNKLTDIASKKSNNDISFIKNELEIIFTELKNNIELLKKETNKIRQKYETNNDRYFMIK